MKVSTRADDSDKHSNDVTFLLYHQGILYSGGDDGKIKAWQPDLKIIGQVQAHPSSVYCLTADDKLLYSCSNDGTVKAWDLKTLKDVETIFNDKEVEFWRVTCANNCLYAGDNSGFIRVFKEGKFYGQFNIAEPVKDMIVNNELVYTVKDLDLVVTNVQIDGEKLQYGTKKTITGKAPLTIAGDKLVFTSRDGRDIIVHDNSDETHFKQVTEVKAAHEMIINSMAGANWDGSILVFSGGWDKVVKKWRLDGGHLKQETACNTDIVINSLITGEKGFIYAGGSDGHIIRLDI